MRKSLFALLVTVTLGLSTVSISAEEVIPASISYNGVLETGESIFDSEMETSSISPRIIIGYEYVPGYERLIGQEIDYTYAYVYGSSIEFVEGVSPTYTFYTTVSKTQGAAWNVSASLEGEFDLEVAKAKLLASGGYNENETIVIEAGQSWECQYTQAGFYDITWYMRGHKYIAQCGTKLIATGVNDGEFYYKMLGTVTFPRTELHVDIKLVEE